MSNRMDLSPRPLPGADSGQESSYRFEVAKLASRATSRPNRHPHKTQEAHATPVWHVPCDSQPGSAGMTRNRPQGKLAGHRQHDLDNMENAISESARDPILGRQQR